MTFYVLNAIDEDDSNIRLCDQIKNFLKLLFVVEIKYTFSFDFINFLCDSYLSLCLDVTGLLIRSAPLLVLSQRNCEHRFLANILTHSDTNIETI